ncbi:hypothetical protein Q5P01_000822 [Channa striata]|uniref:Uncharacterized protein n=1 Tax=Channa striata TaxID=64152 RepID=A0AA88IKI7_CHASR|nr:hypothetical protein Q5P01_000822 [Channa striata]
MNTRKLFLSNCALNPPTPGGVSTRRSELVRDSKSDHLDVPCTLWKKKLPSRSQTAPLSSLEHSGPSRPELTEVETPVKANPPVETGLSDIPAPEVHAPAAPEVNVDVSTLSLGFDREPHAVNPETGPEAFNEGTAACGSHSKRRRRASSRCSLYDEENFSVAHDDAPGSGVTPAWPRVALSRNSAIKAWVLGARAHGVLTNIGALIYGDATVRTFAALDLSQTVNGFLAHKLARYAKTKALAETLELLADNPLMNLAGTAANVFFFAQNVRNVAEGHHSPTDYYWLTRSSMQMLSLVFESLNAAMLPMVSVDILLRLIVARVRIVSRRVFRMNY